MTPFRIHIDYHIQYTVLYTYSDLCTEPISEHFASSTTYISVTIISVSSITQLCILIYTQCIILSSLLPSRYLCVLPDDCIFILLKVE